MDVDEHGRACAKSTGVDPIDKVGGDLRVVHDTDPRRAVTGATRVLPGHNHDNVRVVAGVQTFADVNLDGGDHPVANGPQLLRV